MREEEVEMREMGNCEARKEKAVGAFLFSLFKQRQWLGD